ncbi:hypothetical protein HPB49_017124 [Dermacentor silvarum]|uniref:Uncharacterized protein n=1 Tax=Dermacentor silvarum TaxID=543639 RepID=A0ACB8CYU0_DERSI|nr:hypothetical protein HPB49_017124 [Dermacentor silvarum]
MNGGGRGHGQAPADGLFVCVPGDEPRDLPVNKTVKHRAATNRKMWTHLGVSGKLDKAKNFFEHPVNEDRKVFAFSDVPHLFKYIRNRLLKQRLLKVNGQWVKWDLYTAVYKEDCKNAGGLKVCPKITEHHIPLKNGAYAR